MQQSVVSTFLIFYNPDSFLLTKHNTVECQLYLRYFRIQVKLIREKRINWWKQELEGEMYSKNKKHCKLLFLYLNTPKKSKLEEWRLVQIQIGKKLWKRILSYPPSNVPCSMHSLLSVCFGFVPISFFIPLYPAVTSRGPALQCLPTSLPCMRLVLWHCTTPRQ